MTLDTSKNLNPKEVQAALLSNSQEDLDFRNQSFLELASLHYEKCDFKSALSYLKKTKTEALRYRLYDNYFHAITILIRIHAEKLEHEQIKNLAEETIQLSSGIDTYRKYASKLKYNQAIAYVYAKDLTRAGKFFKEALAAAKEYLQVSKPSEKEKFGVQKDILRSRFGLANNQYSFKNYDEAEKLLKELNADLTKLSHESADEYAPQLEQLETSILIARGNIYREKGECQKALDFFWKAHAQIKTHKVWCYYYYVLLGLGRTHLAMGDTSRARTFFDLVENATENLEFYALKEILRRESLKAKKSVFPIIFDRNNKLVIEKEKGEIYFERRFILLEILCLIASAPGRTFSKQEIVEKVWHREYNPISDDNKVYTSINRIRKLIEVNFKQPYYILNERDGYSFNPKVNVEWCGAQKDNYTVGGNEKRIQV